MLESDYLQEKNEDEKFQKIVYVTFEKENFIYQLSVMQSVCDEVIANQSFSNSV